MGTWIFGAVMALLSLIGLFIASRAHDTMFYTFGMLLFLFGLAIIFAMIHRYTDYSQQHRHGEQP